MKIMTMAAGLAAALMVAGPVEARTCENSHGRDFHCHRLFKPRINFHKRHPIKILRCRAHHGKLNRC